MEELITGTVNFFLEAVATAFLGVGILMTEYQRYRRIKRRTVTNGGVKTDDSGGTRHQLLCIYLRGRKSKAGPAAFGYEGRRGDRMELMKTRRSTVNSLM